MKTNYFEILSLFLIVIISIITFYVLKLIFKKDNPSDLAKDLDKGKAKRADFIPPIPRVPPTPETCAKLITDENTFTLLDSWKGKEMIPSLDSDWEFFIGVDPTRGHVKYEDWDFLLIPVNDALRIEVDWIPIGNGRRSVRLLTKNKKYSAGGRDLLFIIDAEHIPEGLSVWPAFWLANIPDNPVKAGYQIQAWACGGEIDIIEGCNSVEGDADSNINLSSLHTNYVDGSPDCIQSDVAEINNVRCDSSSSDLYTCGCNGNERCPNLGCGKKAGRFGNAFNKNGGGVYACELAKDSTVTIWYFPRNTIPDDISCDKPTPLKWLKFSDDTPADGRTVVKFNPCPGHFRDLELIVNTTICGEWAGNVFKSPTDTITTTPSERLLACNAFSVDQKNLYHDAYWHINYVKVFEKTNLSFA